MKSFFTGLLVLLFFSGADATNQEHSKETTSSLTNQTNSDKQADIENSPIDIVNLRMRAYNDHDIDKFLSVYSDSVTIYTYPDKQLAKGKTHLKTIFEPMFKEKSVSVKIHHQIAIDSYVINHETVNYSGNKTEYVSVYEVRNGLITSVRFVRD